jgi:hypothetical protein
MSVARKGSPVLLSALPAPPGQRRVALTVSLLLLLMLLATAPFARVRWLNLPVVVPIGKTLMLVADLITAALLFGQYSIERSPRLNFLAAGYLFTALITIPHTLTFPGGVLRKWSTGSRSPKRCLVVYSVAWGTAVGGDCICASAKR